MKSRIRMRSLAVITALALSLAACGSGAGEKNQDGEAANLETGPFGMEQDAADPTQGGTLRVGTAYGPTGLDPVTVTIDGTVGGPELSAIYDVLVEYDPVERSYSPRLAEAIESNEDATEWTLTLREDVEFTDGTPLDAAAVKASIQRYGSSSKSLDYYPEYTEMLTEIATPDDFTVVFKLDEPTQSFPWVLTQGWGMITSPSAVKDKGEDEFNRSPVGAGPFEVADFVPNQSLKVVRNSRYYDLDNVYLDGIKFSWTPDPNALLEALTTGSFDTVLIHDPQVLKKARSDQSLSGYAWERYMSTVLMLNQASGRPTANLDLRRAIAQAIDPDQMNDRVHGGAANMSTALFPGGPLENDVDSIGYDPDAAKKTVEELKSSSDWDGKLTFVGIASSEPQALAVQAALGNVGIQVKLDLAASYAAMTEQLQNQDFDITVRAYSVSAAVPGQSIGKSLLNETGYDSYLTSDNDVQAMAEALKELDLADSDDDLSSAAGEVQRLWNEQVPAVSLSSIADVWLWPGDSVYGFKPSAEVTPMFADTWIQDR